MFLFMETFAIFAVLYSKSMEAKVKFKVVYSSVAHEFLQKLDPKTRDKIIYNIRKSSYVVDPKLFKKIEGSDLWEFRTLFDGKQYRILAFWDNADRLNTLVIATHGFIKKTAKTPLKEIERASEIMKMYFEHK